jgi:hypothetical protein
MSSDACGSLAGRRKRSRFPAKDAVEHIRQEFVASPSKIEVESGNRKAAKRDRKWNFKFQILNFKFGATFIDMKKIIVLIALFAAFAQAQTAPKAEPQAPSQATPPSVAPPAPAAPAAKPGDVDTIEHTIAACYDVISGPAGKRDWDRFRSLFYNGARLIPSVRNPQGVVGARVLTPEEYVSRAQPRFESEGFFERSIANKVDQWDHIAQVFSTYESRHAKDDAKPFARGINSFQLFNDGNRWWIISIFWEAEDKDHTIPDQYLK